MPVYQNLSDSELITFLKEGNAAAYTEIYDRYFQLMFVFAYKKLRDEELAKDFVKELFTKLWNRRDRIGEISNFSTYLFAMLRKGMLNYFQHQQEGERYLEFLAAYSYSVDAKEYDTMNGKSNCPTISGNKYRSCLKTFDH